MLRIEAVVWCRRVKGFKVWKIVDTKQTRQIPLNQDTTFQEIGTIFAGIAHQSKVPSNISAESILDTIIERGSFPDDALRFTDDNYEKKAIYSGCCFGIQSWADLFYFSSNKFVWLGHSPTPEFECLTNNTIRIWANGERKVTETIFFDCSAKEFKTTV